MIADPLPLPSKIALIRRVALAVGEAHAQGMVHRDIKPENILIDPEGEPVVIDFGLARRADPEEPRWTETSERVGTPDYMSPERRSGDQGAHPESDVYAIGVVLKEWLSHDEPSHSPDPRRDMVEKVIEVAVADDPSWRYRDARQIADDLADILAGRRAAASRLAWRNSGRRLMRAHGWLLAMTTVAGVSLAWGAWKHDEATTAHANNRAHMDRLRVVEQRADLLQALARRMATLRMQVAAEARTTRRTQVLQHARRLPITDSDRTLAEALRTSLEEWAAEPAVLDDVDCANLHLGSALLRLVDGDAAAAWKAAHHPDIDLVLRPPHGELMADVYGTRFLIAARLDRWDLALETYPSRPHPDCWAYDANTAFALTELGRFGEALDRCDDALASFRGRDARARLLTQRGVALGHLGNEAESRRAYRAALEQRADEILALANLGASYARSGALEDARDFLELARDVDPENTFVLRVMCGVYDQLGLYDDAIAAGELAIALAHDHPGNYANLAIAYESAGRTDDALRMIQRARENGWAEAECLYQEARVVTETDPERASEMLVRAIEIGPVRPSFFVHAGYVAAVCLGDEETALSHYERGLADYPGDHVLLAERARALHSLGRFGEALHAFEDVLRVHDLDAHDWHTLAVTRWNLEDFDGAVDAFHESVRREENAVRHRHDLARALSAIGRHAEAVPHFETVARGDRAPPKIQNELGVALMRLGRWPEAIAAFDCASRRPDEEAAALYNRACLESLRGVPAEALPWLIRACQIDPSFAAHARADDDLQAVRKLPSWDASLP